MDKTIKLPFELEPMIKTYHSRAFLLGIIQASDKDYEPWLCSKYINCIYKTISGGFDICTHDQWSTLEGTMVSQNMQILPDTIGFSSWNIIEFVKQMMINGYYVTGSFNEYYIPGKSVYMQYDYRHDYLIYGYDDSVQCFYSAGYLASMKYEGFTISYESYYNSLLHMINGRFQLNFFKINNSFDFSINLEKIVVELEDYISSANSKVIPQETMLFGLAVWDKFIEYITELSKNGDSFDLRYSRIFFEHKKLMGFRLQYLAKNNYINHTIANDYNENSVIAGRVFLLSIKYNTCKDLMILNRIIDYIDQIKSSEMLLLNKVVDELSLIVENQKTL